MLRGDLQTQIMGPDDLLQRILKLGDVIPSLPFFIDDLEITVRIHLGFSFFCHAAFSMDRPTERIAIEQKILESNIENAVFIRPWFDGTTHYHNFSERIADHRFLSKWIFFADDYSFVYW
jgi:hypothetical protein